MKLLINIGEKMTADNDAIRKQVQSEQGRHSYDHKFDRIESKINRGLNVEDPVYLLPVWAWLMLLPMVICPIIYALVR